MTHDVSPLRPSHPEIVSTLVLGSVVEVVASEPLHFSAPRAVRRANKPAPNSMVRLAVLNALRPSSYGVRF
ncbi:MAG: hypothetical protein QM813_01630 [Verrucomicrobiota bacterium]